MRAMLRTGVLTILVLTMGGWPAAAQDRATDTDIRRLDERVQQMERDLQALRGTDAARARQLEEELTEVRDEVTFLRVKMRRQETVTRGEVQDVSERLDRLGTQVATTIRPGEIPVGTELDVRLQSALTSRTAQVEDRFEATTVVDLTAGDEVMIPAGSIVRGMVTSVNRAGRVERTGRLTVVFDEARVRGRTYPMRGTVIEALESEGLRGEAGRIGTGAGVGAVIGGILGGVRGALTGILIGAGGVIAATEGEDVELPPGTILRIRLDSPPEIDVPTARR